MSSETRATLATVSVAFHDDGDASFEFRVHEDAVRPVSGHKAVIVHAKLFSSLVVALAGSDAMSEIKQLIDHIATRPRFDDDD